MQQSFGLIEGKVLDFDFNLVQSRLLFQKSVNLIQDTPMEWILKTHKNNQKVLADIRSYGNPDIFTGSTLYRF